MRGRARVLGRPSLCSRRLWWPLSPPPRGPELCPAPLRVAPALGSGHTHARPSLRLLGLLQGRLAISLVTRAALCHADPTSSLSGDTKQA